jgi:hypothetical protein
MFYGCQNWAFHIKKRANLTGVIRKHVNVRLVSTSNYNNVPASTNL